MAGEFRTFRERISFADLSFEGLWSLAYHGDHGNTIEFAATRVGEHFEIFGDTDDASFMEIRESLRHCLEDGVREFRSRPSVPFIEDPAAVNVCALGGGAVQLAVSLADGTRFDTHVLLNEEDGRLVMHGYTPASRNGFMGAKLLGQQEILISKPFFDRLGAVIGYGNRAGRDLADYYADAMLRRFFVTEFQGQAFRPVISSTSIGPHRYDIEIRGGGETHKLGIHLARDEAGRPITSSTDPIPEGLDPVFPHDRTPLETLDFYRPEVMSHLDEQERLSFEGGDDGVYVYEAPGQRYEEHVLSKGVVTEVRKTSEIDDRRFSEVVTYRDGRLHHSRSKSSFAKGDGPSIIMERQYFDAGSLMQEHHSFSTGGFVRESWRKWQDNGMLERSSCVTTDTLGRREHIIASLYDGVEISRKVIRSDDPVSGMSRHSNIVSMRRTPSITPPSTQPEMSDRQAG